MTDHDFRVDLAIPPDEVRCPRGKAAGGHRWDHQDQATIEAIPELTALR